MDIYKIEIKNFKSLQNIRILDPSKFLVFVGSNSSGKSNIFEALEFANNVLNYTNNAIALHGGFEEILNYNSRDQIHIYFEALPSNNHLKIIISENKSPFSEETPYFFDFKKIFSRIFIGETGKNKFNIGDDSKLNLDCSNLVKVLKRILSNSNIKEEFLEYLALLIPEFRDLVIITDESDGRDKMLIYENGYSKPFPTSLISDGSIKIISLLAALYQSNKQQFLCIEEPENGLNPKVVKTFVEIFRRFANNGNYIWLNTHSQSLVSMLDKKEVMIVNKNEGLTTVKEIEGELFGLRIDEAWLTNSLGGGIPW